MSEKSSPKPGARDAKSSPMGIRIPPNAATWGVMKEVDGVSERCRFYQQGVAMDRWPVDSDPPSVELLGSRWGRGRFKLTWLDEQSQPRGVSRLIVIDDPKYGSGAVYPNKPAAPPDGAPSTPTDAESKLLAIAQGKLDPASTVLAIFSLLNTDAKQRAEDAERRAEQEIARQRERARIEREEDDARHRRQREEDDARWKRRLDEEKAERERERERTRQPEAGGGVELALLRAKLEAIEAGAPAGEQKPGFWEEKIGGLIEQIEPADISRVTSALWDALGDAALKRKQAQEVAK